MTNDERLKIAKARDYKVVKGNEVIQRARYDLTLSELKSFSFILSKIKPSDKIATHYVFTINEYCDVLGIERNNGTNIQHIKKSIESLAKKGFWLTLEDGRETFIDWVNKAWIDKGNGKIEIRLDENLQEYVMGLYGNYTQYELICTLPMKSSYSIRIYELLKSYAFTGAYTCDVEELKRKMCCEHYTRYFNFKRRVIEPAVKEINLYTDLEVSWIPITKGRKVEKIEFTITQREAWVRLDSYYNALNQLDGDTQEILEKPELQEKSKKK